MDQRFESEPPLGQHGDRGGFFALTRAQRIDERGRAPIIGQGRREVGASLGDLAEPEQRGPREIGRVGLLGGLESPPECFRRALEVVAVRGGDAEPVEVGGLDLHRQRPAAGFGACVPRARARRVAKGHREAAQGPGHVVLQGGIAEIRRLGTCRRGVPHRARQIAVHFRELGQVDERLGVTPTIAQGVGEPHSFEQRRVAEVHVPHRDRELAQENQRAQQARRVAALAARLDRRRQTV